MKPLHAVGWRDDQESQRLADRAAELFQHSPRLQAQWVEAVRTLRRTGKWILDTKISKKIAA